MSHLNLRTFAGLTLFKPTVVASACALALALCTSSAIAQTSTPSVTPKAKPSLKTQNSTAQTSTQKAKSKAPAAAPATQQEGSFPPEQLFQLILAELAAQRGNLPVAFSTTLELAKQTKDAGLARRATELAMQAGALPQAQEAAALWQSLEPDSSEASNTNLMLQANSNDVQKIKPALAQRIAQAPNKANAIESAGRIVGRLTDKKLVLQTLEELLAPYRNEPASALTLARAALDAKDIARATMEIDRALALKPDWESAAMLRFQFLLPSQPQQALIGLEQFTQQNPTARDAKSLLGRGYAQQKQFDKATQVFEQLLKEQPGEPDVLYPLGLIAYDMKQPAKAEQYFEQVIAAYIKAPQRYTHLSMDAVYLYLAQIAEDNKNFTKAREWLASIGPGSTFFSAQLRRATLLSKIDSSATGLAQARAELDTIKTNTPDQKLRVTLTHAQLLREAGQLQTAYDWLTQAIKTDENNPMLNYDLGMLADRLGKFDEFEKRMRTVMRVQPDSAQAYNALGYSLADRKQRLPEAKELINKAINLSPDDAAIIDSMGWVLYRMGDAAGALPYLERAYSMNQDAEIAAHYGEVLYTLGRVDEARKIWQAAKSREPGSKVLTNTLARFNVSF